MSLTYSKTVDMRGDPQKVIDFAAVVFAKERLQISSKTRNRIEAVNSSPTFNKRQPFQGLSHVEVTVGLSTVTVNADFSGLRGAVWGGVILLPIFGLFLIAISVIVFRSMDKVYLVLLILSPWVIILPVMRYGLAYLLRRNLDSLIKNLAQI